MSQVRKLLKGNNIPKAQKGYKFQLDSQDVYFTDDDLKEIDDQIAALPMEYRRFLGNATTAIKEGNQSGNRADNTVTMKQLSGLDERNSNRLRKQKAGYWEAITNADSYVAKEAINQYLQILASVVNKSKTSESKSKKVGKSTIPLDFNKDKNGKYALSPTAGENFSAKTRIEQILEHLNAGENSPYDVSDWDLTGITGWWNGLGDDKNKAASDYLTDLWNRMSTPGYEWGGADEDFLRNFGITWKAGGSANSGTVATPVSQHIDENGKIKPGSQNPDGTYGLVVGDGKNGTVEGALYTTWVAPDARPYLLNEDRLAKFGLDPSYLNGVIYKNRIYRPEEVSQNVELQQIMNDVITANNSATSADDVWANVGKILNFTDYDNPYVSYDSSIHYMPNRMLRNALGEGRFSIFNPTAAYDAPDGMEVFGVYDFNTNGEGPWNFRTPKYYISGNGTLTGPTSIPSDWTFLNRNWAPMTGFGGWENIRGKYYGLVGQFWGSDAHDTTPYTIYEDTEGTYYTKLPNGNMQRLDDDLALAIITGKDSNGNDFKPNHNQMLRGTFSGRSRDNEFNVNISPMPPPYQNGMPVYRKQGGKVELKPLPFKLQMGSRLAVAPNQPEQTPVQESPLAESSNIWETLTPADQKEIIAAGIDVAGAIAGLVPGGSAVGAATGILGSTPLFMSAAKERKGHLDASDWGQAVLATGLDLVSLIPYLGETGKIAKIAKTVTRVAVPLGKAFSVLGLSQAASVLAKDPKDWDTNDLLKLSAGIQSIINIGHSAYVRHGESALASEISRIKGKPGEIPHSFKVGDTDIKLTEAEIKAITDPSNNPEEILQGILRGRNISDEQMTNLPELLERFGFNTKTKGWGKRKHTVATVKEPEQNPEYTKYGWLLDELDPIASREFRRRAYIDSNLSDENIASVIRPKVFDINTGVERIGPRQIITERTSLKNNAIARAYVQSLARNNKVSTSWFKRPTIDETKKVNDNKPELEKLAQEAISNGEGLPRGSEITRTAANKMLEAASVPTITTEQAVQNQLGVKPNSADRVTRLGANAISNEQLIKELNDPSTDGIGLLLSLSDRKLRSLLNAISKPGTGSRAKRIRREYLKSKGISDIFDSANKHADNFSARLIASEDAKRTNARDAFNQARDITDALVQLRESKDPMKTLRLISKRKGFDQWVYDNPEEFREALEYAKRRGVYSKLSPKDKKQYDFELSQLMEGRNLIFKKGGIVKAQQGADPTWSGRMEMQPDGISWKLTHINIGTNENPIWREIGPDGKPILLEGDLGYSVQSVDNPSEETDIQEDVQTSKEQQEAEEANNRESQEQTVVSTTTEYVPVFQSSTNKSNIKSNSPKYVKIGNVEKNKGTKIQASPLAKQEIIKVSSGNNDLSELIALLKQLSSFKKGGVLKAQNGLGLNWYRRDLPWKLMDDTAMDYNPFSIIPPAELNGSTPEAYYAGAKDAITEAYGRAYDPNAIGYDLTHYGNQPVNEEPVEEEPIKVQSTTQSSRVQPLSSDVTSWRVPGWNLESTQSTWKQGGLYPQQQSDASLWPEGTGPIYDWEQKGKEVESMSKKVDAAIKANNNGFNPYVKFKAPSWYPTFNSSQEEEDDDKGGGPNKDIASKLKRINPFLSLARFGINAYLQGKYRDVSKKAINAARFNELPVRINTARTDSPELDRALQQVNSERMAGMKPVTSDLIANNALWNQREAQLYNREQQLTTQRSQYQKEMNLKNLDIMNQNIQNEISVANSNRARNAAINSALYNPDLEYIQRRGQSIENLGLEIQNNVKKDVDLITAHNKLAKQKEISDATDAFIDSKAPGWRAKYNALTYNERIKYSDFLDYLERNDPNFGTYRADIEKRKQQDQIEMLDWMYENGLNYYYSPWLRGKSSSVGIKKKGGYINGSTRYTKEPDEQIWIDNNKATHRAIGKLNDNTIKLLLRALK